MPYGNDCDDCKDDLIRCQFCGVRSFQGEWKDDRCPWCNRKYDPILAQESDD